MTQESEHRSQGRIEKNFRECGSQSYLLTRCMSARGIEIMKNRLGIILSLLLIFALDGLVLAEKRSAGDPSFSPDGISASQPQRRRKRRRRQAKRPRTYQISVPPDETTTMPPPPPPAPAQQEMPNAGSAPPAPAASDPADASGSGRPAKKAGPTRIKPPTVQIKPPTK